MNPLRRYVESGYIDHEARMSAAYANWREFTSVVCDR